MKMNEPCPKCKNNNFVVVRNKRKVTNIYCFECGWIHPYSKEASELAAKILRKGDKE